LFGKPSATPQSLKTLGGLPEVEALNTVKNVAKTEVITPKVAEPRASQPLRARPSETVPSSKRTIGSIGTPERIPAEIANSRISDQARGIRRQNEAAEVMSKKGYFVEYQPKITQADRMSRFPWLDKNKKPDFKIEGEIFDALSPEKSTSLTNIVKSIAKKTTRNQTRRILLNLDDSNVSIPNLAKELRLSKLPYLDEVIAVKDGKIIKLYPYSQAK
jgi:Contact-dependent growth inhibition CdiA C-terminal domain